MKPYRILIADDHPLFRAGVRKILEVKPDLKIIGEVSDGLELLEFLKKSVPDLIILDISMPRLQGLEALKLLKKDYPAVKVLVLTMHKSKGHLFLALSSGAEGFLLKENAYEDLFTAIDSIRQGNSYISGLVSDQIIDFFRPKTQELFPEKKLSHREKQVLELISQGKTSKEVAGQLAIGVASVQTYRHNLKKKLNIKTNADLIKYAIQQGYVSSQVS